MMLNFLITIDVPNWMETALRTLFYGLCAMIYKLVIVMYNIFDLLCTVRILDMDVVDSLAQRIGLILGLVMLFIVIFSLINSLINPDLVSDKAKSPVNLIKKVLLVIVMFGVSTFAFSGLYYVQKVVIKSNVIVKLFVPGEVETDNFGNFLTKEMFMSFYTINEDLEGVSDSDIDTCEGVIDNLETSIEEHGTFEIGRKCLYKTFDLNGDKVFIVDFSYFYSLIVGGFLVYFLFMYCLSVGVRTFQLVFLEIISPMAFVGYLSPKNDNMFSKWIKMYFATYLDLFIRIGIISFATFIIGAILGNGTDYGNLLDVIGGTSGLTKIILKILLIFALLTFAKKAPDLLKDLFPSGASKLGFGVGTPKQMFSNMIGDGNLVKRTYGAASVGARTIGRNLRKGVGNAITAQWFDPKATKEDKKKAWLRAGGSLFTGFGGIRRGLMTTDKSSRRQAVDNAYAATQSKYKMRDLGYGASALDLAKIVKGDTSGWKALGNQAVDQLRAAGMQDQYIEDMASMKDFEISNLQEQLSAYRKNNEGNDIAAVAQSKTKKQFYLYQGKSGPVLVNKDGKDVNGNLIADFDLQSARTADEADEIRKAKEAFDRGVVVADYEAKIGKATGDSKKLHQKAEEQKQGKK